MCRAHLLDEFRARSAISLFLLLYVKVHQGAQRVLDRIAKVRIGFVSLGRGCQPAIQDNVDDPEYAVPIAAHVHKLILCNNTPQDFMQHKHAWIKKLFVNFV